MRRLVFSIGAAAFLLAAAERAPACGGAKAGFLERYYAIAQALAEDRADAVWFEASHLAREAALAAKDEKGPPGEAAASVAKAAEVLAPIEDLAAQRNAFADLSRAAIAYVEAREAARAPLPPVHLFECPSAASFGRWLQADDEPRNPYLGSRGARCAKLVRRIAIHDPGCTCRANHGGGVTLEKADCGATGGRRPPP